MSNKTMHATRNRTGDRPTTDDDDDAPVLELREVEKSYGPERVIEGLSLSVHEGEILTLLGPSGCGKTTTLRLIAGLERPNGGEVALNDATVSGPDRFVAPEDRGVGVVVPVLQLDEPFSNLDVDLRVQMREEVRRILKKTGVTAVSVTHDQEEALSISDRVAVMNDGRIEQVGDPEQVFQQPESRFVAGFLGHASFLPGYVHGGEVTTGLGPIPRDQINGLAGTYDRTRIDVLVRPDDIRAVPVEGEGDGRIVSRRYLGPTILYEVRLDDDTSVQCMHNHDESIPLDTRVRIELDADHELAWFPSDQRPPESSE
jgi:ABC-type Fe3+/spermidine/putrescine transport system ATPase subunit